jgi:glycosyltransferase involved in cell wall biosynthesis
MRLMVGIPCLNEADTVADVIKAVRQQVTALTLPGLTVLDVVIVDDGSRDQTAQVATEAGAAVLSHGYNRGVGIAFQTMLQHAMRHGYDAMVNIDADGQFDAAEIIKLVGPVFRGEADFVSGSRFMPGSPPPQNIPPIKLWGNHQMSKLIGSLAGRRFYDVSCGFRAYSRECMLWLNLHGRFTYTQETFLDVSSKGLRTQEVPVTVRYFDGRVSRVANSITKYAMRTSSIILRVYRDYHPLKFFGVIAMGFFCVGVLLLSWLSYHYLTTGKFTGQIWAGFTGGGFALVGLLLLIVGVVADMLDRIRVNQERILYLLKRGQRPEG